jgi:hypothetical protein
LTDNLIGVTDEALLFPLLTPATLDDPQVAWIGTERILYHGVNATANELIGVIRGTNGTHAQAHQIGAKVFAGGLDQVVPSSSIYWVNSATAGYQSGAAGQWRYNGNGNVHFSDHANRAMVTSIALNSGGTATYVVGDVLTVVGGTFTTAATVLVTEVTTGVIDNISVIDPGVYTVFPGAGAATSGGGGTLATVDYSGPVIEVGDTLRVTLVLLVLFFQAQDMPLETQLTYRQQA